MQGLARFSNIAPLACLVATSVAAQPPMAEQVPASPMLYVGWRGADAAAEPYEASKLKAVLEDTGVLDRWAAILSPLADAAIDDAEADDPRVGAMLSDFAALAPLAWSRPWAVYVDDVAFSPDGEAPTAAFGFVMDAGPSRDEASAAIDRLIAAGREDNPRQEFAKIDAGGVVGFVVDEDRDEPPAGLDGDGGFDGFDGGAMLEVRFDAAALWASLDGIEAVDEIEEVRRARTALAALGLASIERVRYAAGFDDTRWRSEMHVTAPAPRRGLWTLLGGEPLGDAEWAMAPETATWARLYRFDPAKLIPTIRETLAAIDPEALAGFDGALAEATAQTGVDLDADLAEALGDAWAIYAEPSFTSGIGPGVAVVNKLRDEAALADALAAMRDAINRAIAENGGGFRVDSLDMGALTVDTLALPVLSLAWAAADGHFFFGTSPAAVVTAHAAATDPTRSLAVNAKFRAVRDRLAAAGAPDTGVSVMFADIEGSAARMYPTYAMLLNLVSGPIMQETGQNALNLLPPLGALIPHLGPAGAVTWLDDEGLHQVHVTPFPGATLLSPEAGMAYTNSSAPLAIAILLPALQSARSSAQSVVALSSGRQLAIATMAYAVDHDDAPPDALSDLLTRGYLDSAEVFVSPTSPEPLPEGFDARPAEAKAQWLRSHASFVLVPSQPLRRIDRPASHVLLFLKPSHAPDIDVLAAVFADGHAEAVPRGELDRRLRGQTGAGLAAWVRAAEAGEVPAGFDPEKAAEPDDGDEPPPAPF